MQFRWLSSVMGKCGLTWVWCKNGQRKEIGQWKPLHLCSSECIYVICISNFRANFFWGRSISMSTPLSFHAYFRLLFVENVGVHWFVCGNIVVRLSKKRLPQWRHSSPLQFAIYCDNRKNWSLSNKNCSLWTKIAKDFLCSLRSRYFFIGLL